MKLKEYLASCASGDEITCWDNVVDSEFYFYTKEEGDVSLYGEEFPNVDRCVECLSEYLDVVKVHKTGVEVNLYELFEHPDIIEYAKEHLYNENQYEDDADVTMLLFDDNVTNLAYGYENFSGHMVKCLEAAYGREKVQEHSSPAKTEVDLPEHCYGLLPSTGEIIILRRGMSGYYVTSIGGGDREFNRQLVDEYNDALGVSKAQAAAMSAGSMFGWSVPAADPRTYDEAGQFVKVNKPLSEQINTAASKVDARGSVSDKALRKIDEQERE